MDITLQTRWINFAVVCGGCWSLRYRCRYIQTHFRGNECPACNSSRWISLSRCHKQTEALLQLQPDFFAIYPNQCPGYHDAGIFMLLVCICIEWGPRNSMHPLRTAIQEFDITLVGLGRAVKTSPMWATSWLFIVQFVAEVVSYSIEPKPGDLVAGTEPSTGTPTTSAVSLNLPASSVPDSLPD